jgi:tetratricopeptide (TPR) repeat protein
MNRKMIVAAAVLFVPMAGCAHSNRPGPSQPQTNTFETAKEPAISARTHFAAGQLAETQSRPDVALKQYKLALAAQPNYLDAIYRLGVVYALNKDYPHAIETWNKYVAATGGSATAYNNLGFCQELAGNPAAAEAAYKSGIARDRASEPCHVNYGLMLARHNRPSEALIELQVVLAPAKAHYDLASVYQSLGKKLEAKAEYQKAVALDPQLEDARNKLTSLKD